MTKIENYPDSITEELKALYSKLGNEGLPELVKKFNKTLPSIRAKLVKEGVYITPDKSENARKNGPSKKEIIREFEDMGINPQGLEGATKEGLLNMKKYIDHLNEIVTINEKSNE